MFNIGQIAFESHSFLNIDRTGKSMWISIILLLKGSLIGVSRLKVHLAFLFIKNFSFKCLFSLQHFLWVFVDLNIFYFGHKPFLGSCQISKALLTFIEYKQTNKQTTTITNNQTLRVFFQLIVLAFKTCIPYRHVYFTS